MILGKKDQILGGQGVVIANLKEGKGRKQETLVYIVNFNISFLIVPSGLTMDLMAGIGVTKKALQNNFLEKRRNGGEEGEEDEGDPTYLYLKIKTIIVYIHKEYLLWEQIQINTKCANFVWFLSWANVCKCIRKFELWQMLRRERSTITQLF